MWFQLDCPKGKLPKILNFLKNLNYQIRVINLPDLNHLSWLFICNIGFYLNHHLSAAKQREAKYLVIVVLQVI